MKAPKLLPAFATRAVKAMFRGVTQLPARAASFFSVLQETVKNVTAPSSPRATIAPQTPAVTAPWLKSAKPKRLPAEPATAEAPTQKPVERRKSGVNTVAEVTTAGITLAAPVPSPSVPLKANVTESRRSVTRQHNVQPTAQVKPIQPLSATGGYLRRRAADAVQTAAVGDCSEFPARSSPVSASGRQSAARNGGRGTDRSETGSPYDPDRHRRYFGTNCGQARAAVVRDKSDSTACSATHRSARRGGFPYAASGIYSQGSDSSRKRTGNGKRATKRSAGGGQKAGADGCTDGG